MTTEPPPLEPVRDENGRIIAAIGRLTAVLVAFLAMAAFGLSFEALWDLAVVAGGMKREIAWLFPLIVDGGIIVFSLAALRASITGADRRWFMSLVVIVTLFSVGLNIAHANNGWLPAAIASMPPLLLFLAFESLMRQIHDTVIVRIPKKARPGRVPKPVKLSLVGEEAQNPRKAKALELSAYGWSQNRIARELKMAPGTVRKYLEQGACA